jgi:CRP/FNR family cyclic AMP-dependent transcriptional regulator
VAIERRSDGRHLTQPAPDCGRGRSLIRLLAGTELFGQLPSAELAAAAARFHDVRYGKGEMLFGRGDPGHHLYLIADGRVRLATATSEGRELSFQIAAAGEVFGEIALLDGGPRSAEATALTRVTAHTLERSDFSALCSAYPAISTAMISFLCRRVRGATDKLEDIALYPMVVRLARFLLAALGDRQSVPDQRLPLELGYSQTEIALLLGASRPKLNSALTALEHAGAVTRADRRLFCDPVKLARAAKI